MRDALVIIFAVLLTAGIVYAGGLGIDLTVELTSTGGGGAGPPGGDDALLIEGTSDCLLIEGTSDCILLE